jgi:hypothetical protein
VHASVALAEHRHPHVVGALELCEAELACLEREEPGMVLHQRGEVDLSLPQVMERDHLAVLTVLELVVLEEEQERLPARLEFGALRRRQFVLSPITILVGEAHQAPGVDTSYDHG